MFEFANATDLLDTVQKNLVGEALWSKDAANAILDKLSSEFKIMTASRNVGIESGTFAECVEFWTERIKFVRVPCEILTKTFPEQFSELNEAAVEEVDSE